MDGVIAATNINTAPNRPSCPTQMADESIWAIFYPTVARAMCLHEDLFKATRKPDDCLFAQAMTGDLLGAIVQDEELALTMVRVLGH
ncbi:hypothetical protein PMZ80_010253 [Knufia obscura]|uniref:Uncharacterized protein n=2 Tax=Knufia TaxID=430999 RepID=A0AAN8F7Y8_9EURO|nr:hypothetical protein PMZ80_010253 [Knufia obscura]KAK5952991.1 hypothetical protein OHC33_006112 [Knufia fluminis]